MAKKSNSKRVFQLAKELGVTSKDIITKCKAEEIPGITNHMSTVSMGLAATIGEWFGDSGSGGTATAVETAAPVDVSKARAKAKKKTKMTPAELAPGQVADTGETETLVAPPPVAPVVVTPPVQPVMPVRPVEPDMPFMPVMPTAPVIEMPVADPLPAAAETQVTMPQPPASEPTTPIAAPQPPAVTPEDPGDVGLPPAAAAETPMTDGTDAGGQPIMNVPVRPVVVAPAGPQLQQPSKTKLAGPKVIRVETPDVLPPPRPRGVSRPGGGDFRARTGRGVDPGRAGPPPDADAAGAGRGGRRPASSSRRNKRRTGTGREDGSRTGRAGSAGPPSDRPFNWREQDLLERERRLSRAGGFFKAVHDATTSSAPPADTGTGLRTAAQTGRQAVKVTGEPIFDQGAFSRQSGIKQGDDILKPAAARGSDARERSTPVHRDPRRRPRDDGGIRHRARASSKQKSAEQQIEEQFEQREMVDEQPRSPGRDDPRPRRPRQDHVA